MNGHCGLRTGTGVFALQFLLQASNSGSRMHPGLTYAIEARPIAISSGHQWYSFVLYLTAVVVIVRLIVDGVGAILHNISFTGMQPRIASAGHDCRG